jgi:RimJ/RimL family protein N-acetyltransferase
MWKSVHLGTPVVAVKAAIAANWFRDEEENYLMGFGRSFIGQARARDLLGRVLESGLGVYLGTDPVGVIWLHEREPESRSVRMWAYVIPAVRNRGVGPIAVTRLMDDLFEKFKRVEIEVLQVNRPAVELLKKAGFAQEGVRRTAHWMHGAGYNVVPFRMLQRQWKQRKRNHGSRRAA